MRAHIYGLKHSHPALAARMALERTGVPFVAHDLFPGLHGVVVRARGFRAWTVPALEIDGRKVQGTLAIARELDRVAPDAGSSLATRSVGARSRRPSGSVTTSCSPSRGASSAGPVSATTRSGPGWRGR